MKWGIRKSSKKKTKRSNPKKIVEKALQKPISAYKPPKMSAKERVHVQHEIMTWLTKEDRWTRTILSKPIGKFVYTIHNFGDGTFEIIAKRPNKK